MFDPPLTVTGRERSPRNMDWLNQLGQEVDEVSALRDRDRNAWEGTGRLSNLDSRAWQGRAGRLGLPLPRAVSRITWEEIPSQSKDPKEQEWMKHDLQWSDVKTETLAKFQKRQWNSESQRQEVQSQAPHGVNRNWRLTRILSLPSSLLKTPLLAPCLHHSSLLSCYKSLACLPSINEETVRYLPGLFSRNLGISCVELKFKPTNTGFVS